MGCGDNEKHKDVERDDDKEEIEDSEEQAVGPIEVDEQISIINDNYNYWKITEEDKSCVEDCEDFAYAITDLDKDGFLEVVKSCWNESLELGDYHTVIYEVESKDKMIQWNLDSFMELDEEPCFQDSYIIDDSTLMSRVITEEISEYGGHEVDFYKLSFKDNSPILDKISEDDKHDYLKYLHAEQADLWWFKDVTLENIKSSYDHKYLQDEKDASGLYTAFLNNEKPAIIDIPESEHPAFEYKVGESVDLETLESRIAEAQHDSGALLDSYEYIDCGPDGEYELQFSLQLEESYGTIYMFVAKEIDGKIYIKYLTEKYEGNERYISNTGYVGTLGQYGEHGYLDKDANYHFYYTYSYYLDASDFWYSLNYDDDLDWENFQVMAYCFDDDNSSDHKCYYQYFYIGPDENEEQYLSEDSVYYKTFIDNGFELYTDEEMDLIFAQKASEIGLDDNVRT
jgi:hypothetical protein